MSTKVAVISSKAFQQRLLKIAEQVRDIELDFYIYGHPSEAPELLKEVKSCDVLFITGTLPYLYSKPILDKWPIPWTYLKQDEFAIANTLLAFSTRHHIPLDRISIDVMNKHFVENVLTDIEYIGPSPYVIEIDDQTREQQLIEFHTTLWTQQKINHVITSSHNVFEHLQKIGVPVFRVTDSSTSIVRRLEETKSLVRITKSESAKVVVGLLEMNTLHEETVDQIAQVLHAIKQPISKTQIEFYTTMGHLQHAINRKKLATIIESNANDLKLAFGYGLSVNDAEQNAMYAMQYTPPNNICIVDEQKHLINPLHHEETTLSLQIDDPYIMKLAKNTKLSPLNISKIIAFAEARQSPKFTAHDLAEYLQVTRRTTERIIKRLVTHEYVQIVGEEMGYTQGRPRTIYELKFSLYNEV
ncbi:helix-turn-helix domain-containing protein [Kurthia senegalensis]|uniref:helix-turn-helix domain-containing protein n=1 Tax=Kurthia senegalensis TaxID=1033740 RepID=UPI000288178B|nr:helix-turn-helix domain-containing protein [Kurthia senegalensis]